MAKIMIVDDEISDLQTMQTILEKAKYDVETVSDGASALDLIRGDGIDLILVDIKMPTLSGYDLLRLLRERVNHDVKVVYVSIVPKTEVVMKDVDGFVQKPFSASGLLKEVKSVLGSKKKRGKK
jgi:DNA-binding response OmpR family regulator